MLPVYEELSETSRRQILSELRSGPKNVGELCRATGLKQPNVSNHLGRMRQKKIVQASKVGRQVYYSLASPEVEAVVNSILKTESEPRTDLRYDEMAKRYAKAAVQGDEATCTDVLDTAFRSQAPLLDIYQDILAPAMTLVGTWWKVEAIDEAQEHLATEITLRMMARTAQIAGPVRRTGHTALLGCGPNSWHVIGLRMIADYLRLHGWRSLFLGANVPIRSFVATVQNHRPTLVLVSCGAVEAQAETLDLIRALADARTRKLNYRIGVGGFQAGQDPEPFRAAGADFFAADLRTFALEFLPGLEGGSSLPATDRAEMVTDN